MKTLNNILKIIAIFGVTYSYLKKYNAQSANREEIKLRWALDIAKRLNMEIEVVGEVSQDPSVLFLGNHISYLDVLLLMSTVRGLSFVAKAEVQNIPVIGKAAADVGTVFVKRENDSSRKQARLAIQAAMQAGKRVAVFPAGTTTITESISWRRGAFEIAEDFGGWVQPFRLIYSPLRPVAYIDDDVLFPHLMNLLRFKKIQARIEFLPPIQIKNAKETAENWQGWCRDFVVAQKDESV